MRDIRDAIEATLASNLEFKKGQEAALNAVEQVEKAIPNSAAPITSDQLATLNSYVCSAQKRLKATPYITPIDQLEVEFWRLQMYFREQQYTDGVTELIIEGIPKFVYYSNHGNLDAEIYLPQAIENMTRTGLTGILEAKARTLKVLFEYIGPNPTRF